MSDSSKDRAHATQRTCGSMSVTQKFAPHALSTSIVDVGVCTTGLFGERVAMPPFPFPLPFGLPFPRLFGENAPPLMLSCGTCG